MLCACWTIAYNRLGIVMTPSTLTEFMTFMTSSPHSHAISFQEFRDFLLLMPRKASPAEIFRYYEVKKFMGDDGRGAARVNMEGQRDRYVLECPEMLNGHSR